MHTSMVNPYKSPIAPQKPETKADKARKLAWVCLGNAVVFPVFSASLYVNSWPILAVLAMLTSAAFGGLAIANSLRYRWHRNKEDET